MSDPYDERHGEVRFLIDVLREADVLHRAMVPSVQEEIERGATMRELARMALHFADMSTATRSRLVAALEDLVGEQPAVPVLHLVPAG